MFKTDSPIVITISKLISNFFNPLVSLLIYFIWFSLRNYTFDETLRIFLPILLITIIPIVIWIVWNVKTGKYSNMDVSDRIQRKSLYAFVAVAIIAYILFEYFKYDSIDLVMIFILILLLLMQFSNFFIKSSMHTAFNVFVAALFFAKSPVLGMVWLGIAIQVGITRVILKRHTVKEVLMGMLISGLVSFIYLYANIVMNN